MAQFSMNVKNNNNPTPEDYEPDQEVLIQLDLFYGPDDTDQNDIFYAMIHKSHLFETTQKLTFHFFVDVIKAKSDPNKNLRVAYITQYVAERYLKNPKTVKWLSNAKNKLCFRNGELLKGIVCICFILYRKYATIYLYYI